MPVNPVYLLVATSAFFWGANFVLAAPVLSDIQPLWAAAFRFVLGGALMLSLALFQGHELFSLARRHAATYLLLGLIGIAAFNLFFFRAMETTSADNGALIMATNPLLTTLLGLALLGERVSSRQLIALPIALIGVAVVISHGHLSRLSGIRVAQGDMLMLGANLTWALFNVFSRRYMPNAAPTANTALMMTAGAVILLFAAVTSGSHLSFPGTRATLALVVMAVGGTVLAYLFWGMGIKQLGAGKTSLFLNLVPVFAMLLGGVTGALPTASQALGGLIVLASVTIAMMPSKFSPGPVSPRS